ncbi:hypothetical protein [Siphonobacter sp.]|uniref:hypothetical protein n=1 Tax=Siphonobacter sp. TaxID=1869184 RepID=UPI003B3A4877
MKTFILRFLFAIPVLVSFSKCTTSNTPVTQESLSPCKDKAYELKNKFENITGTIVEAKGNDIVGEKLFYIDATNETKTIPFNPCNLPEKAKVNGLKVKFSGHTVTYPGYEMIQVRALAFQLTEIEYK